MALRAYSKNVTTTGAAANATGSATVGVAPGKLVGVLLDWQITQGAPTADVTISNMGRNLLVVSNSTTDAYVPVVENSKDSANAAAPAGDNRWEKPAVNGTITISLAQADAGDPALTVTLLVEH